MIMAEMKQQNVQRWWKFKFSMFFFFFDGKPRPWSKPSSEVCVYSISLGQMQKALHYSLIDVSISSSWFDKAQR